jgi:hypothetical protein
MMGIKVVPLVRTSTVVSSPAKELRDVVRKPATAN